MEHYRKKYLEEMAIFIDPKTNLVTYCDTCKGCENDCKQSYRATVIQCPDYIEKAIPEGQADRAPNKRKSRAGAGRPGTQPTL